jgi:hypothetical protein
MLEKQRHYYEALVSFFRERRHLIEVAKSRGENKSQLLNSSSSAGFSYSDSTLRDLLFAKFKNCRSPNVAMELRMVSCHPLLRRFIYNDDLLPKMTELIMNELPPDRVYQFVLEDMSVMNDYEVSVSKSPYFKTNRSC